MKRVTHRWTSVDFPGDIDRILKKNERVVTMTIQHGPGRFPSLLVVIETTENVPSRLFRKRNRTMWPDLRTRR